MDRDTGRRRAGVITAALAAASVAGVLAAGAAAYAATNAASTDAGTGATSTSNPTADRDGTTGTAGWPSLSGAGSDSGHATSGGS